MRLKIETRSFFAGLVGGLAIMARLFFACPTPAGKTVEPAPFVRQFATHRVAGGPS